MIIKKLYRIVTSAILLICVALEGNCQASQSLNSDQLVKSIVQLEEGGAFNSDPELKRKAQDLKASYEKQEALRVKLEQQREKVEILKEMQRESNKSPDRDMYPEVLKRSTQELNLPSYTVRQLIEQRDPRIEAIWNKMVSEDIQRRYNEIKARRDAAKAKK